MGCKHCKGGNGIDCCLEATRATLASRDQWIKNNEPALATAKRLMGETKGRGGDRECGHPDIEKYGKFWRCADCQEGFMSYNDVQILLMKNVKGE